MEEGGDRPQRARGINLTKFTEKCQSGDFDAPLMPIYYRPSKKSGLEALFQKFPREALITFSDKFRKQLLQPSDPDNPPKAIYLDKGGNKEAFKEIFNWIKQCIAEAGVAEFEKYDEDAPETIPRYIEIVRAAEYLEVPARDMQEKIEKRVRGMVQSEREKSRLIDFDLVEELYSDDSAGRAQTIAAAVIFFCWWNGHLDSDATPEAMEKLADLREEYPKLNEDLKDEFLGKVEFIEARKKKKAEELNGDGTGDAGGGWDGENTAAVGGGRDDDNTAGAIGGGDWDKPGGTGDGWSGDSGYGGEGSENVAPASGGFGDATDGGAGGDWADEVNQHNTSNGGW